MPTKEAIVDNIIPKEVPKPIPVRVISTRTGPRMKVAGKDEPIIPNGNQQDNSRTTPAADTATPEESVRLSPQLSALARKEQAHRNREQALAQREKDLESRLAKAQQFENLESKLGSKDYSELEKLGLNYEGYTEYLISKQAEEDPSTQAYKKLESEIQGIKKEREEQAEQEFEETKAEYQREIKSLVASSSDFTSIKEMKAEDAVLTLIMETWEEDNEHLTVAEACKEIEAGIVEHANKFASLSKLKPKVDPEQEKRLPLPPPSGTRTLTNNMQPSNTETVPAKSLQHLSEADRYAEARRRVLARRQQGA